MFDQGAGDGVVISILIMQAIRRLFGLRNQMDNFSELSRKRLKTNPIKLDWRI